MRSVFALAALAFATAGPALAEPASQPNTQPVVAASIDSFREQTNQFQWDMGNMRQDMSRAVSVLETREIAARYQPVADALADRIEARRLDEGRTTGRYSNARYVRDLPDQVRRETDRARMFGSKR